jgi:hypothetical protein
MNLHCHEILIFNIYPLLCLKRPRLRAGDVTFQQFTFLPNHHLVTKKNKTNTFINCHEAVNLWQFCFCFICEDACS